jgi:small GTP-binding protein
MFVHGSAKPVPFKVVFLGNASSGKTSIIRRYCDDAFTVDQPPTIGSAFVTRSLKSPAGDVQLQIWDTAGEERYRSLVPMYSRGAAVAVVVFDLSNSESFADVAAWIRQVHTDVSASCRIVVAGNKLDLRPQTPLAEIDQWAAEQDCQMVYVSALDGTNIGMLFDRVVALLPRTLSDVRVVDNVDFREVETNESQCC